MDIVSNASTCAWPSAFPWAKAALELAGVLQQRLDDQPLTFPDNRYDSRHLLYFSAEVTF